MAGFVDNLERSTVWATSRTGFVCACRTTPATPTSFRPFGDDDVIVNLTVWESVEALRAYAFRAAPQFLRRRREWFRAVDGPYLALWWRPGELPTVEDAVARLAHLAEHGPSSGRSRSRRSWSRRRRDRHAAVVEGGDEPAAHVRLPVVTYRDEHGRGGFFDPASHLYPAPPADRRLGVDGPPPTRLRPSSHRTERRAVPDPRRRKADVSIGWQRLAVPYREEFKRDADGDELYFVHSGEGVLRTEYSPLDYRPGHYMLLPRGTTYRFEPSTPTDMLAIEARAASATAS